MLVAHNDKDQGSNPCPTTTNKKGYTMILQMRKRYLLNTDPQRRCYNGAYFSSEFQWGVWKTLDSNVEDDQVEKVLKYWKELNEYAVSQRGESARSEFRIIPEQ